MALPEEFRPACRYTVSGGQPSVFETLDPALMAARGVVYARVVDGEILYIGKSDGKLASRMGEHRRLMIARKNQRGYLECVEGRQVTILAYHPPLVRMLDRDIAVHRSIESALITEFKPRFVKRG
jgi:hypothetical protein